MIGPHQPTPFFIPHPAPARAGLEHHYLPIPEPISQGAFYISTVGLSRTLPHQPYPPARHPSLYHFDWKSGRTLPEFGLLVITEGKGSFESKETGRVEILPGMAVFTFPGVWHRYRPDSEVGWMERWMHFDGALAHALLNEKIICPQRAMFLLSTPEGVVDALDELLMRVHRAPVENSLLLSLQAIHVLTLSLAEPQIMSHANDSRGRDPLVDRAVEYIWSRSHHVLSVEDVVVSVGVARRTLERRMQQALGHGILGEIIECRYNRAERLLRETDLPISTVVNLAGFGSDENMRQVFLCRTHLAPAHYRIRNDNVRPSPEADL